MVYIYIYMIGAFLVHYIFNVVPHRVPNKPKRVIAVGTRIIKKVESHAPSFVQICLDFK